jgi:hypothetical protein
MTLNCLNSCKDGYYRSWSGEAWVNTSCCYCNPCSPWYRQYNKHPFIEGDRKIVIMPMTKEQLINFLDILFPDRDPEFVSVIEVREAIDCCWTYNLDGSAFFAEFAEKSGADWPQYTPKSLSAKIEQERLLQKLSPTSTYRGIPGGVVGAIGRLNVKYGTDANSTSS